MERVMSENNIYRAALYCRLSKDDEQAGDSVSIETQRMMLTGFCYERGIKIYEVYTDDGYSGLNFERPAERMSLITITPVTSSIARPMLSLLPALQPLFPLRCTAPIIIPTVTPIGAIC